MDQVISHREKAYGQLIVTGTESRELLQKLVQGAQN